MRNRGDIVASILLILVGVAVSIESIRLKVRTFSLSEPGSYPLFVGLLLMGIALFCWHRAGGKAGILRQPMILLFSIGAYTALMNLMGYVLQSVLV